MAAEKPHPRQVQSHLQALSDDIHSNRNEIGCATTESYRIRIEASIINAAAIANDNSLSGLVQRVQSAEYTQQALLAQAAGQTPNTNTYGGYGYVGDPLKATDYWKGTARRLLVAVFSSPIQPRQLYLALHPPTCRPPTDSRSNRTNHLETRKTQIICKWLWQRRTGCVKGNKASGKLRNLYFGFTMLRAVSQCVIERQGNKVKKCKSPTFTIKCFQEGHFHYCRRHMRIIPADKPSCSPTGRADRVRRPIGVSSVCHLL